MKSTFPLAFLLFSTFLLFGQPKKFEPLIIEGQIYNSNEKYLTFSYQNNNGEEFKDTIKIDATGKFYLKTYNIQLPQRIMLQQKGFPAIEVFVAPGYNLTIKANKNDNLTIQKLPEITGKGADANRYTFLLESANRLSGDTIGHSIHEFSELKDLVFYLNRLQKMRDSIAGLVFDKNSRRNQHLKYFGNMVRLDNQFATNYFIVQYLTSITRMSIPEAIIFLKTNFNNYLPANLSKDEYLRSSMFKFFINQYYIPYVLQLSENIDSIPRVKSRYNFEAIRKSYTGKVQEYIFYNIMKTINELVSTFEALNRYQTVLIPFQKIIKNSYYKKNLQESYIRRQGELHLTEIGKPAPSFTLEDNFKNEHSLSDFKGKVVYLDLWASWCGPCRAETPAFKVLFDKYKNDDRIVFISIAVADSIAAWKKALATDKPEWLQLIDKNDLVKTSYDAGRIPKFILVDKEGHIINFDAPRPSNVVQIEKLINQEIIK